MYKMNKTKWIIPEQAVGPDVIEVIRSSLKVEQNRCITGFFRTGKTTALLLFARKIRSYDPAARILLLGYSNLWVEIITAEFSKYGFYVTVETYWSFKNSSSRLDHYDYILCDDVQVVGRSMLCEIKSRANHVIVSINPELEIFAKDSFFEEAAITISDVEEILQPEVFELSAPKCDIVLGLARSFLDKGNSMSYQTYKSAPSCRFHLNEAISKKYEVECLKKKSSMCQAMGRSTAILIPTKKGIESFVKELVKSEGKEPWTKKLNRWGGIDFSSLNEYLSSLGLKFQCLGGNYKKCCDLDSKISIMTYHASMGFSFDDVFLPYLNSDLFLCSNETMSRHLFAMALTRSKNDVYLFYSGSKHPYIDEMTEICNIDVMDIDGDICFEHLEI